MLSSKIFDAVTKDVEVTDQDILDFYTANQSQYGTPESRDVRHILIAEKKKDGSVDFAASKAKADEVYAELEGGADFATLAKQLSADPGSAKVGGKLTITRGQTVPEFDKAAFDLDDERALEAGQDDLRLPHHRAPLRHRRRRRSSRSTRSSPRSRPRSCSRSATRRSRRGSRTRRRTTRARSATRPATSRRRCPRLPTETQ